MFNKLKRNHILVILGIVSLVTLFSFQNCSTVQKNMNIEQKAVLPVEQTILPTATDVGSEKPENLNDLLQQSESELKATREQLNLNNVKSDQEKNRDIATEHPEASNEFKIRLKRKK